ncbi:NAD(P)H dehydrogenase (quinone) [Cypionkella aquatica]|uniref:NAD(P)H dehydrogenase (Quinone) n=1 Tax=Cypionkella aquatica TaxID=1756042 RepID=A0AA37U8N0_9RHOB|nr:NAD(P)H-dependent oxidoreductase [Cypionkella aquatica]GLS87311.1 NAD(P)H dehydrogenase (quinone) [Cypionkella aquatica]
MRLLFLHAHPDAGSFTAACRDTAIAAARAAGHETRLIDLYAEDFQPTLSLDEWRSYPDPDAIDETLTAHIEALHWAEGLIFTHPTWWSGPPAILKGWLDRTFRPGVAFHPMPNGLKPGLPNIRLLGVITSLGATRLQYNLLLGAPGKRQLLRGLRACTNRRCKTLWLAHYAIDASTDTSRAAQLEKIAARMAQIAV